MASAALTSSRWLPAAIYTRVSTNKQLGRRVESCESQEAICRDYIASQTAAKGWEHVTSFTDPAYSGATMKRPGMDALKHAIAAGQVKVVVIFKLERVLRSTDEWAPFRAFLREHDCELVSAMEDISETTALGRLKNNLLVSVSEYDRLNIAEKVRAKMGEQARRGLWNGGAIPYGYAYDKNTQTLSVHPQEGAVVRRIYESAAGLMTLTDLANRLNAEGFRTKERYFRRRDGTREVVGQQRFRSDGLRKLITNPIYRGAVRFEGKEFKGQHPALIPDDLWERANASVREVRQRPEFFLHLNSHGYLLKGLCHCGHCGRSLIPKTTGISNNARKHYSYYNCGSVMRNATDAACPVGRISAPALESTVLGFMAQLSQHPSIVSGVLQATRSRAKGDRESIRADIAAIETRLEKINHDLGRCVDAVTSGGAGALGPELLKRAEILRSDQTQALVERERKRQDLAACEAGQLNEIRVIESLGRFTTILPRLSSEERTELVRLFVERVEVRSPGRVHAGEAANEKERILAVRIKVYLPGLVEGVEKTLGHSNPLSRAHRLLPTRGVNFETKVDLTQALRGVVTLLAPFQHSFRVAGEGKQGAAPTLANERTSAPQHLMVKAQHWRRLLDSGQVANRVALAKRFGVTPGAITRTLKLVELVPEIQNFLGQLTTKPALRHFGMKRIGALSDLSPQEQLAAFETIRRAFAQPTPDLVSGVPVKSPPQSAVQKDRHSIAERIVELLRRKGPTPPRGISAELQLAAVTAGRQLAKLVAERKIVSSGNTRGKTYAVVAIA